MHCPFCQAEDTKVTDSRLALEGAQVRRRRSCPTCGERFTTYETIELVMPNIVKNNGSAAPFDEEKLRTGMMRALQKRPVSMEAIDQAIARIVHDVRALGEKEISSKRVGEFVMSELANLDQVAYVRFASVYRQFQDLEQFKSEIDRISQ